MAVRPNDVHIQNPLHPAMANLDVDSPGDSEHGKPFSSFATFDGGEEEEEEEEDVWAARGSQGADTTKEAEEEDEED